MRIKLAKIFLVKRLIIFCNNSFIQIQIKITMNKYDFLENQKQGPLLIQFGELGTCQLISRKADRRLFVLKVAPRIQAQKQIQFLTTLRHPHIIEVIDYINHKDSTFIVFQFFHNGDLYTKIRCREIKHEHISMVFKDICSAIDFIHSRKVIHRNLKSQNIMINDRMEAKIMDFGLAARLSTRKTVCGCLYFMPPEILKQQFYDGKVDVWALGIILYQMSFYEVPFEGETAEQILNSIYSAQLYKVKAEKGSLMDLIQMMLSIHPRMRPTIYEVLQHPFLKLKKDTTPRTGISTASHHSIHHTRMGSPKPESFPLVDPPSTPQRPLSSRISNYFSDKFTAICDSTGTQKRFFYTSNIERQL